jgi:hypothetical protein
MIAQQKKNTGILCRSGFGKQAVLETPLQRSDQPFIRLVLVFQYYANFPACQSILQNAKSKYSHLLKLS